MSNRSFETAVKGATKVKLAPPKSKYVEVILLATQSGEAGVAEIFRTLTHRLRDSTWTVAFKSLIIVHLMIKEGARDVTLGYLSVAPAHRLAINNYTDVQTQGQNIRRYSEYLLSRAKAYEKTGIDYVVQHNLGHFKKLTVEKGILRESEIVLDQISKCTKCNFMDTDTENEISLTAFRLLTRDLLDLYAVINEAIMNILQKYFEMSRPDAERAVKIYRKFCACTEQVVTFLRTAQQYSNVLRLEIPKLKHAPVDLANTLQEYLDDKDFDIHRRQYLAQQESKRSGKATSTATFSRTAPSQASTAQPKAAPAISQPTGPAPDLIDFFESIEQNQQPMMHSTAPAGYPPTGFNAQVPPAFQQPSQQFISQQQTASFAGNGQPQFVQQPFGTLNAQQTGFNNGFGQAQQQPAQVDQFGQAVGATGQTFSSIQPQSTNPFRKSMLQPMPTGFDPQPQMQPQNTNPFAHQMQPGVPATPESFQAQPQPIQPQATGTNPFARAPPVQQSQPALLQVQATGSTNPFRQSTFINQNTGAGWQSMQQPTMGGLEQLPTVPVFPRPNAAHPQGQYQQASPWG